MECYSSLISWISNEKAIFWEWPDELAMLYAGALTHCACLNVGKATAKP